MKYFQCGISFWLVTQLVCMDPGAKPQVITFARQSVYQLNCLPKPELPHFLLKVFYIVFVEFYMDGSFACMYIHVPCVCIAYHCQKRALNPLGLQL